MPAPRRISFKAERENRKRGVVLMNIGANKAVLRVGCSVGGCYLIWQRKLETGTASSSCSGGCCSHTSLFKVLDLPVQAPTSYYKNISSYILKPIRCLIFFPILYARPTEQFF